MEMERVTEFLMSQLDLRSRKTTAFGLGCGSSHAKGRNIRFALSDKELIEEEYRKKFEESKKKEVSFGK
ncbi:hypothetical protein HanRHA438_Chr07g0298881 [Helianthus annuus]|nr:hypothetical protein HanRHA438_Chr07g0298881 [Helianthus annuus]